MVGSSRNSVAVFLVAVLFFLAPSQEITLASSSFGTCANSAFITSNSLHTKSPLDYSWNLSITDLDATSSVGVCDYSFHEYSKVEVQDDFVFVAKGTDTPSQLLCINKTTGDIEWDYFSDQIWNANTPFVCLDTDLLLNYNHCICLLDKKTGDVIQTWEWDETLDRDIHGSSLYGIYANSNKVILQDNSKHPSVFSCFEMSTYKEQWVYQPENKASCRVVGIQNGYLEVLELVEKEHHSKVVLRLVSIETGKAIPVTSWENVCRIDCSLLSQELIIGVLTFQGEVSLSSVIFTENNKIEVDSFLENTPVVSLQHYTNVVSTLQVEDDVLGFRVWSGNDGYSVAVSTSLEEKELAENELYNNTNIYTNLYVSKFTQQGELVWSTSFASLEKTAGIVEDAFVQEDKVVFQFPYRTPFMNTYVYAFWVDMDTGVMCQSFYDNYFHWFSGAATMYPVFYSGIVVQTSQLNHCYVTSIQGYSYSSETIPQKEDIPIEYSTTNLQEVCTIPYSENLNRMPPFMHENCICFFQTKFDRRREKVTVELIRYDVQAEDTLPVLSFTYRNCETNLNGLCLLTDSVVLGYSTSWDEEVIVCFDIVEKELLWEKEAFFIELLEDNVLYSNSNGNLYTKTLSDHTYTLFSPLQEKELTSFTFPAHIVEYVGTTQNKTALFQRDGLYISMFDLQTGSLQDEIFLSETEEYQVQLLDDQLFYSSYEQSDKGIMGCLSISLKKQLWEQFMGSYCEYFYAQKNCEMFLNILPLHKDVAFGYQPNGCLMFDRNTGVLLKEYNNVELQIRQCCMTDSCYPLFQLYSHNTISSCLQLHIEAEQESELLVFPAIEYPILKNTAKNDGSTAICSFTIQSKPYYVLYGTNSVNFVCICTEPFTEETVQNAEILNMGADISNYLYWSTYLLFQCSVGDKNSGYHLVAYNTKDGSLTLVHKGFHERVFIENETLHFFQYGVGYSCPLGAFSDVKITDYEKKPPGFTGDTSIQPYTNYQEGVPAEYSALDLYYINKIVVGNFTSPDTQETLFITGDHAGIKIGIMGEKENRVAPVMVGSFLLEELDENEDGGCQFYQSMILDVDSDGLDECVILTKSYLFVCEYCAETDSITMNNLLLDEGDNVDHEKKELLLYEELVYLQYFSIQPYSNEKEWNQFYIEYNPLTDSTFSLQPCSLPLPSVLFEHQYTNALAPFQFLEHPVVDQEVYVDSIPTTCSEYPRTSMPPIFEMDENQLQEKELAYCQKRNTYVQQFLSFLEAGNDPFQNITVKENYISEIVAFTLSLSPNHKTELQVTNIFSLDVLQQNGEDYILLRIAYDKKYRGIVLLSSKWEVLDYRSTGYLDQCDQSSIIISTEQPDYFWIQLYGATYLDEAPMLFFSGKLTNGTMKWVTSARSYGIVQKNNISYFTISHTDSYIIWCREGWDFSKIYDLQYEDPFSGASVNGLFITEINAYLEAVYTLFLQNQQKYVHFGHSGSLSRGCTIQLSDGRWKSLDVEEIAITVLTLEHFLRTYSNL